MTGIYIFINSLKISLRLLTSLRSGLVKKADGCVVAGTGNTGATLAVRAAIKLRRVGRVEQAETEFVNPGPLQAVERVGALEFAILVE